MWSNKRWQVNIRKIFNISTHLAQKVHGLKSINKDKRIFFNKFCKSCNRIKLFEIWTTITYTQQVYIKLISHKQK